MILKSIVEVDGLQYELQHPGAREWMRLQNSLNEVVPSKDGSSAFFRLNQERLLEYSFEYVIAPINHDFSPTLDRLTPDGDIIRDLKALEVWQLILPRFFRGDFTGIDDRKPDNRNGGAGNTGSGRLSEEAGESESENQERPDGADVLESGLKRRDNRHRHRARNRTGHIGGERSE